MGREAKYHYASALLHDSCLFRWTGLGFNTLGCGVLVKLRVCIYTTFTTRYWLSLRYNTKGTEIWVECSRLLPKYCGSFVLLLELWNIYASLVSALRSFIFLCWPVPTKSFCVVAFISVLFRSQAQRIHSLTAASTPQRQYHDSLSINSQ